MVENDTLWLFTGHDMEGRQKGYVMRDWQLFSTTDMTHWTQHPCPLTVFDFKWATSKQAYAGHVAKRNDKYYFYVSTNGSGIGVAVSDKITGPYKDAIGKPLLTRQDCFDSKHGWCCIDSDIHRIAISTEHPFEEAPWLHKYQGRYYLTYASGWPEKIAYAIADNVMGPYKTQGVISEIAGNSNTTHPAIVQYKGQWLFFSHNGGQPEGGSFSRSVVCEPLYNNADGSIRNIPPTTKGICGLFNK